MPNEEQVAGHDAYPSEPVCVQKSAFRSPTCELSSYVVVSVHCPQGNREYKPLERTWIGCRLRSLAAGRRLN